MILQFVQKIILGNLKGKRVVHRSHTNGSYGWGELMSFYHHSMTSTRQFGYVERGVL